MRRSSEQGGKDGLKSGEVRRNARLFAALNYEPIRSAKPVLIFEVRTFNPFSGQRHLLELKHELRNGNNRFNLYIDGKRERNQWSRWGVCGGCEAKSDES